MRIDQIPFEQIKYTRTSYPDSLYRSLKRIGLNFPIQVGKSEQGYTCIDGHKRMSAIADILQEDTSITKFEIIPALVKEHARSEAPYHLHNHH